jgi:hypothetical protein
LFALKILIEFGHRFLRCPAYPEYGIVQIFFVAKYSNPELSVFTLGQLGPVLEVGRSNLF